MITYAEERRRWHKWQMKQVEREHEQIEFEEYWKRRTDDDLVLWQNKVSNVINGTFDVEGLR